MNPPIFVSLSGNPTGDGSYSSPVNTIQAGIELAREHQQDVYVAGGRYSEDIDLANGVSLYGGWGLGFVDQDTVTVIQGSGERRFVVYAKDIEDETEFQGFQIEVPDVKTVGIFGDRCKNILIKDNHVYVKAA